MLLDVDKNFMKVTKIKKMKFYNNYVSDLIRLLIIICKLDSRNMIVIQMIR